jgi:KEOPS complex subunit Cgi121
MSDLPVSRGIRTARCIISNRLSFLQDLQGVASAHSTHIICFNADFMAGTVHAQAAIAQAVRAFREGTNISNTLEMESLLYAAGSRQCSIAASFGVHEGENRVYVCCYPERKEVWSDLESLFGFFQEDWDIIDQDKRIGLMRAFTISSDEITAAGGDERIVDLVLERVALLQVIR